MKQIITYSTASLVPVSAYGPLEEASTSVAGWHAIVLARRLVPAHATALSSLHLRVVHNTPNHQRHSLRHDARIIIYSR